MPHALDAKEFLNRKECSAYLAYLGCPLSVGRLANLASNNNAGKGPPFYRTRWSMVFYKRVEVEAWTKDQTKRIA